MKFSVCPYCRTEGVLAEDEGFGRYYFCPRCDEEWDVGHCIVCRRRTKIVAPILRFWCLPCLRKAEEARREECMSS